ncbi:M14 family zinc carboxypeptidase [Gangjinia marincola]
MREVDFTTELFNQYDRFKYKKITGRYIPYSSLTEFLDTLSPNLFTITEIGFSVEDRPINLVRFGNGKIKILGWSQMHGNESTTTKAVVDFLNFINIIDQSIREKILSAYSFAFIPMLNPDGSTAYTRENANEVDLNRDATELSQPESKALHAVFNSFTPHYCLNLHDQRSIFSVGNTGKSAAVSFLAPAADIALSVPAHRKTAMQLICSMNVFLQKLIPGQVGTYDDTFNINCTGDYFQASGVPTILFEAGHIDYAREKTRKLIFGSLLQLLKSISSGDFEQYTVVAYDAIPQNKKLFVDILIRKANVDGVLKDVGIQYKEQLINGSVDFKPTVTYVGDLSNFNGHREIDAVKQKIAINGSPDFNENVIVDEIMLNQSFLSIKIG